MIMVLTLTGIAVCCTVAPPSCRVHPACTYTSKGFVLHAGALQGFVLHARNSAGRGRVMYAWKRPAGHAWLWHSQGLLLESAQAFGVHLATFRVQADRVCLDRSH
jgi:hypothetical protein